MSKKLLGITFLVGLVITLVGLNFMHIDSKNPNDFITWLLPTSIGVSLMMICGLMAIRKFVRTLSE
jgi:formate-dependent nitrite reductase membrane component NrfD